MMEAVIGPDGTAPTANINGYRVAGKTGTAQRVDQSCGCYDGSFTVSFAGFAPADDPRFVVYVVVQQPKDGNGGGMTGGPVFHDLMAATLQKFGVPPTGTRPSPSPGRVVIRTVDSLTLCRQRTRWVEVDEQQPAPSRPTSPTPVPLSAVAAHLGVGRSAGEHADVSVTGVSQSSRSVGPGRRLRRAARRAHARSAVRRGGRGRRSGGVRHRRRRGGVARPVGPARPRRRVAPRRARLAGRARPRRAREALTLDRRHRHAGQDHGHAARQRRRPGGRSAYRGDRHDGHLDRRCAP